MREQRAVVVNLTVPCQATGRTLVTKNTTGRSHQTKTADKTSKTPRALRHREDIETAPPRQTEVEIAEGDYYHYLERLGAPSAQKVALARFRKLSVVHFTR